MAFQLHPDARDWFKKVRGKDLKGKEPLETLFDVYQMCFVLGIVRGRFEPLGESGDTFMDEFIQRYRAHYLLMVGSMISRSLQRQGVPVTDRKAVVQEVERFVDSSGVGMVLRPEGFRELNGYAAGGFRYLTEELTSPPGDMVYLLDRYAQLLKKGDSAPVTGPQV
jgi:hypothetical protein